MKNGFWIGSGVVFVALAIVYFIFVSGGRDAVKRSIKQKNTSIKKFKKLRDQVKSNDFPTNGNMGIAKISLKNVNNSLKTLDDDLINIQGKFHFVKGEKTWNYTTANALQYKSWYDQKRDRMVKVLLDSNFILQESSDGSVKKFNEQELKEHYGNMGFQRWSNSTPKKKEVLIAHQKLVVIGEIINSLSKVFVDQKKVRPVLNKIEFSGFMDRKKNSRMATSRVDITIDVPYAFTNKILSELESNKLLRFEIDNQKVWKMKVSKDFVDYPNVSMKIILKFSVFTNPTKL